MQSKERKILKLSSIMIVVLIIIGFALFQSKNIMGGPKLSIESPRNGEISENSLIEIQGSAENISEIKFNGRQIFVDERGLFSEKVLLSLGYNKVIVEAKDRFGRVTQKSLQLVLKN